MARQKKVTPATVFSATVRTALEHIADPAWLGANSPLATPYFLGAPPSGETYPTGGRERGLLLQGVIHQTATEMWDGPLPATRKALEAAVDEDRAEHGSKSSRYHYLLLELRYLRRHFTPNAFPTAVEAMPGYVNVSPTRFFIHLDEAIEELCRRLLGKLNPALRLERPGLSRAPIGRATIVEAIIADLQAGRTVAVTGQGGVGKTTAGAAVIAAWPGEVFWHTFHPGLNDDLNSLLFGLGHFTRVAGAPALWAQLLAAEGQGAPVAQAAGMLRLDLEAIAHRQPLLCFDEVDLLQTSSGDPRRKQHAQVLEFLESLRGAVPLLLIGQRVYVDTQAHYALEPLTAERTGELLRRLGLEPDAGTLNRIHQYTAGNPRLLELYAALRHSGEAADDILRLPRDPSARPLFSRLWRRLGQDERNALAALSVFRSFAPRDAWPAGQTALTDLIDRGLIKTDLAGGVALLPFFCELVFDALSPDLRNRLHRDAAHIRVQRGDYTAAAHHYVEAGEPGAAVEVWFAHQDGEILAGQAAAADEVFRRIALRSLEGARRTELLVIHNRLALLAGEAERVLEEMEGFTWDINDETTADVLGQLAYAYELQDQTDRALAKYDEAITMLSRATTKIIGWRLDRGYVFIREVDPQSAKIEARLAAFDIERLLSMIEYSVGRFEESNDHIRAALQIADEVKDKEKSAWAHYTLSLVAGRQARIADAHEHANIAMALYAETGNRLQVEGLRAELAGMYLNVRRFEEVIEPSEKALQFFERIKHDVWISHISANLAEAYMETGRLEDAKRMAFQVIQKEVAPPRPYALYTLGHIHDREGQREHAAASFTEGIEVARANSDPFIEAYLERAFGQLLLRHGETAAGREHMEAALALFNQMGLTHEIEATEAALSES